MRAVEGSYYGETWWPVYDDEDVMDVWLRDEESNDMPLPRLHVRYDNGQLCTFRRKETKK